jgi:hypothetical protein
MAHVAARERNLPPVSPTCVCVWPNIGNICAQGKSFTINTYMYERCKLCRINTYKKEGGLTAKLFPKIGYNSGFCHEHN